jgi:hypothetical protein
MATVQPDTLIWPKTHRPNGQCQSALACALTAPPAPPLQPDHHHRAAWYGPANSFTAAPRAGLIFSCHLSKRSLSTVLLSLSFSPVVFMHRTAPWCQPAPPLQAASVAASRATQSQRRCLLLHIIVAKLERSPCCLLHLPPNSFLLRGSSPKETCLWPPPVQPLPPSGSRQCRTPLRPLQCWIGPLFHTPPRRAPPPDPITMEALSGENLNPVCSLNCFPCCPLTLATTPAPPRHRAPPAPARDKPSPVLHKWATSLGAVGSLARPNRCQST